MEKCENEEDKSVQVPELFIEEELFNFEKTDLSKEDKQFNFRNAYNVLQCLTLKSANDNFDLERYEILGVSFSIYIFFLFYSQGKHWI